ncbi:TspO/MBR family protein [soil metagenome]
MKPVLKLIISIAVPLAVGAVAGFFTTSAVEGWFTSIIKPSFNPPNWLFAPVWTILYMLMGVAFYLVWKQAGNPVLKRNAIILYSIQLALNFLWSFIFFYAHQPGWALVDIVLLWLFIVLTIIQFGRLSTTAAWLLAPYICWVSFAAILNLAIWELN